MKNVQALVPREVEDFMNLKRFLRNLKAYILTNLTTIQLC